MARENMAAVSVPEQAFDTDALVMYQGNSGDYAYDGPVIWHEFGHGAIYSTANWNRYATVDARSANDESSALHEGSADVVAFMVGNDPKIGAYVGPRADPTTPNIRDVNNTAKCPDVLWGESHQDSLHYTGAIWQASTQNFQSTAPGTPSTSRPAPIDTPAIVLTTSGSSRYLLTRRLASARAGVVTCIDSFPLSRISRFRSSSR